MYEKEDDILRNVTKIGISLRSQKDIEVFYSLATLTEILNKGRRGSQLAG